MGAVVSGDERYDVAVVGGGGGGLSAALSARENGASVILVDAAEQVGGSTALSGGAFLAGGTDTQRAAGFPGDSAQEFYDFFMAVNRWNVEPAIVRRYCDSGADAVRWLASHGVEFSRDVERGEIERVPRLHRASGGGAGITAALGRACARLGVDIALGTRVDDLVTQSGTVTGIRAGDQQLDASAVVLASGGFANNHALVAEHIPFARPYLDQLRSPAASTNRGEGLEMAVRIGAATAGHNRAQVLLSSGIVHDVEPVLPGWLICVDRSGRRFVDETVPYHVINPLTRDHGGTCWAIFDDAACRAARGSGSRFGPGLWQQDILSKAAEVGQIACEPDLESLAAALSLPAGVLRTTVERYNQDCERGADSLFFKDASTMVACRKPPFYGVALRPTIMPVTGYGLRIDADARVLREADDQPIPGLYAAGEVVGNVVGPSIFSGGAMIAGAVIFGRHAGEMAAKQSA
jgi:succinate dehydrogenase/fumarate reductase flavoprotein subunit